MKKAGVYGTREFFGLTEVLRSDQKNIQALFGRYLVSPRSLRLAIVDEILSRLRLQLAVEDDVFLSVIQDSGPLGRDRIEDTMTEYEDIQAMFRQVQADKQAGARWDELFEDMMQTVRVHFLTEARDVWPLVDRSRDA